MQSAIEPKFPVVALIAARGGSVGVPRKNVRLLGGKPLIALTIEAAKDAQCIDSIFVTTEDDEIARISRQYGAEVLGRPECLAEGHVQSSEVYLYALRQLNTNRHIYPRILVILAPTSPFRTAEHIDAAYKMYRGEGSVIGASKNYKFHWAHNGERFMPIRNDPLNRRGRQWVPESDWLLEENGSLYIVGAEDFSVARDYHLPPWTIYPMPEESNFEIDTEFDFWKAEKWVEYNAIQNSTGLGQSGSEVQHPQTPQA